MYVVVIGVGRYAEMPRKQQLTLPSTTLAPGTRKATISQYFPTSSCVCCHKLTTSGVCGECQQRPQHLAVTLAQQLNLWQRTFNLVDKVVTDIYSYVFYFVFLFFNIELKWVY